MYAKCCVFFLPKLIYSFSRNNFILSEEMLHGYTCASSPPCNRNLVLVQGASVNCTVNAARMNDADSHGPTNGVDSTQLPPPTSYRRANDLKTDAVRFMLKQRSEGDASGRKALAQPKRNTSIFGRTSSASCTTTNLNAQEWSQVFKTCCKSKNLE